TPLNAARCDARELLHASGFAHPVTCRKRPARSRVLAVVRPTHAWSRGGERRRRRKAGSAGVPGKHGVEVLSAPSAVRAAPHGTTRTSRGPSYMLLNGFLKRSAADSKMFVRPSTDWRNASKLAWSAADSRLSMV